MWNDHLSYRINYEVQVITCFVWSTMRILTINRNCLKTVTHLIKSIRKSKLVSDWTRGCSETGSHLCGTSGTSHLRLHHHLRSLHPPLRRSRRLPGPPCRSHRGRWAGAAAWTRYLCSHSGLSLHSWKGPNSSGYPTFSGEQMCRGEKLCRTSGCFQLRMPHANVSPQSTLLGDALCTQQSLSLDRSGQVELLCENA